MIVFQHGERSKKIIQPYGSRHSYEDWGELRPNLAVMLSADDDEFSGGSGTHGLYALAHESGSYMRELRRAHGALASHDLSNEEVQALADRTLERATAGRDLWRKIVPTLQDAIRALSGAAEEEDRRLRRPRLVEEEGEPPSDAEVASQHRAEDIEHMFMENPEMLGLRPEDVRRDLITGGRSDRDRHINLPDGRRIRFSRDIINALHERIETTLSGDSYLYIENWREADWSLNFRAVAEYAQFILEPIIAFEEVFEAIIREAVRIKALVSPPASRLRSV